MFKQLGLALIITLISTTLLSAKSEDPIVRLETSQGDIFIELYYTQAPITCKNFLEYVNGDFYDNTIFHRVVQGFVIQGGGYVSGLKNKQTLPPIKNEAHNKISNKRGTVAMARTREIDSATSQFFINLADNQFLDHQNKTKYGYGYAVFGRVIQGMDIVDKINQVKTSNVGPFQHVPVDDVVINKVTILRQPKK
ncbi:peptidylprolyl isomerase [Thermoproteota archaeon]